jgi:hypothetical protein
MFTTNCFIRKNTPELRKKLEELGYEPCYRTSIHPDEHKNIVVCKNYGSRYYGVSDVEATRPGNVADAIKNREMIDCGDNEELFLALAALRDDTDKWQLFIFDGIDVPDYFLQKGDMWICSLDKHLVENCHKATVEEIIEHYGK